MINEKYRPRFDHYNAIGPGGCDQLEIYKVCVAVYNFIRSQTSPLFIAELAAAVPAEWESTLQSIRDTVGLSKCWGYATELLRLISVWRDGTLDATAAHAQMMSVCESLVGKMLELLPAYSHWTPQARVTENQPIIEFLNKRCNGYRLMGNPKIYAYDNVMENLASTALVVDTANYKYIKGVGPKMSKHILGFLNELQSNEEDEEPVRGPALPCAAKPLAEDAKHPRGPLAPDSIVHVATPFRGNFELGKPIDFIFERDNLPLAQWLWEHCTIFNGSGQLVKAYAWRTAVITICQSCHKIRAFESIIGTDACLLSFPGIGEHLGNVIREFYSQESQAIVPLVERPISVISDVRERFYHQKLIDLFWVADERATATEVYMSNRVQMTKKDFTELRTFKPEIHSLVFSTEIKGAPVCQNWINQRLANWLWSAGRSQYNVAKTVARNKTVIIDPKKIRGASKQIIGRIYTEVFGHVVPELYNVLPEVSGKRKRS